MTEAWKLRLQAYGYDIENTDIAMVSAVHKERYELLGFYEEAYGRLKTSAYYGSTPQLFPTVGDFVEVDFQAGGDYRIRKTLPRSTYFARADPSFHGQRQQAVAANFNYVFIMTSLNQDCNIHRLERYVSMAWESKAQPVIILTKADLTENQDIQKAIVSVFSGVTVHCVSAHSTQGLTDLTPYLQPGKMSVLLGSSGVGKSSLVNALMKETAMKVNDIREKDDKGRHTTTHRQCIVLPNNAFLVDTPGMREIGFWEMHDGLDKSFEEIAAIIAQCRFTNCSHQNEPGCAVQKALQEEVLSGGRWNSYRKLLKETEHRNRMMEIAQKKEIGKNNKRKHYD